MRFEPMTTTGYLKHNSKLRPKGEAEYLIKWCGYGDEHNTWEPLRALANSMELIEDYEDRRKKEA